MQIDSEWSRGEYGTASDDTVEEERADEEMKDVSDMFYEGWKQDCTSFYHEDLHMP